MISDIDASLSVLLKTEALNGSEAEIAFDAPTTEWASRRSGPVVDVFLYDIREDVSRRDIAVQPQRDQTGRITGRRPGLRHFRLSYLLTAWTRRPEDEHRLLDRLLETLLLYERMPAGYLRGRLRGETVVLGLALPPTQDRSLTDLWSALGGEMKPSIDLVAVVPVRPGRSYPAGPPVQERDLQVLRHRGRAGGPATADRGQPAKGSDSAPAGSEPAGSDRAAPG